MARLSLPILLAGSLAIGGCGGSSNPDSGGSQSIRGNERIGWDQQAASPSELASFRYAIYRRRIDQREPEVSSVESERIGGAGSASAERDSKQSSVRNEASVD